MDSPRKEAAPIGPTDVQRCFPTAFSQKCAIAGGQPPALGLSHLEGAMLLSAAFEHMLALVHVQA